MKVAMPEVIAQEFGGTCTSKCFDAHSATIELSDEWQEFDIPWAALRQAGFGEAVVFDPKRLIQVYWDVEPNAMPADYWIDDVRFLKREDVSTSAPADTDESP
jgi:licheninase